MLQPGVACKPPIVGARSSPVKPVCDDAYICIHIYTHTRASCETGVC